jgi:hypothetical protein
LIKKIIFTLFFLLFSSGAISSPFLVCDPQTGVKNYKVSYDGCNTFQPSMVAAQLDGSIKLDLATLVPGTYNFCLEAVDGSGTVSGPSKTLITKRYPQPRNLHFGK